MTLTPFIHVRELSHAFLLDDGGTSPGADAVRQVWALRGVSLSIERGEFVALIGPNGSGKSTLARHLNGLLLPSSGEVAIDGLSTAQPRHLPAIRQRVGMVFQNPENQLVASTVEEDVAFGPENLGLPPPEIRRRVDEALDIVGLGAYRHHPPQLLSGGQKQRAAIAGVLASRPACIVCDEPTSMLDPGGRRQVIDTLHHLNAGEGLTVVLITQSMDEAAVARRVVVMAEGRVVGDGPPAAVFDALAPGGRTPLVEALGLDLPFAVQVARRLRGRGLELAGLPLTVEQLAAVLC